MITVRKSTERGHADHGWLDSRHTFSFADYYDPKHMGFRSLRVINEDRVAPNGGFGMHPHRDMEIVSYVLSGALEHRDSLQGSGGGATLRAGEVQRMSAGTGIVHSEFNPSPSEPVHFLQIWLQPDKRGIKPSYEQKAFLGSQLEQAAPDGRLRLVASPAGESGSLHIHTDARIYAGRFVAGQGATLALAAGRHAWVQVARGQVKVDGHELEAGDGAAISQEAALRIEHSGGPGSAAGSTVAEVLVFDLP